MSSGPILAGAWKPTPGHAFGLSLKPGYPLVEIEGIEFLQRELPPLRVSETPRLTGAFADWELSTFLAHALRNQVEGRKSIPMQFDGGEAIHAFGVHAVGLSVGWGFGERDDP